MRGLACTSLVLIVWAGHAMAQGQAAPKGREERIERMREEIGKVEEQVLQTSELIVDRLRDWWQREVREIQKRTKKVEPLGRTVKMQFRLVPEGKVDVAILCATTRYSVGRTKETEDGSLLFEIQGSITPLDDADRLLLTYEVEMEGQSHEGGEKIEAQGSTAIKLDEEVTLVQVGDGGLVALVSAFE